MSIIETPPSLTFGTKDEYIDRLRQEYSQPIAIPEGLSVLFFLNENWRCEHFLCGKNQTSVNKQRARRILWIKFILENQGIRLIKKDLNTNNILFICEEVLHVVICSKLRRGDLKCFTHHPFKSEDIQNKYADQTRFAGLRF
ncbi:hypothetical protein KAR28_00100 [Candidatus Parcubacteria bacterium]|nr:hypothetical protein [Candidatus Parcubacteria bacterium]